MHLGYPGLWTFTSGALQNRRAKLPTINSKLCLWYNFTAAHTFIISSSSLTSWVMKRLNDQLPAGVITAQLVKRFTGNADVKGSNLLSYCYRKSCVFNCNDLHYIQFLTPQFLCKIFIILTFKTTRITKRKEAKIKSYFFALTGGAYEIHIEIWRDDRNRQLSEEQF